MSGLWIGALALAVVGVAQLAMGFVLLGRRKDPARRVAVEGRLVTYQHLVRSPVVTFDYPLPDGRWTRGSARAWGGLAYVRRRGLAVDPGTPLVVYVDADQPSDVSLNPSGARSGLGVVFLMIGGGSALAAAGIMAAIAAVVSTLHPPI